MIGWLIFGGVAWSFLMLLVLALCRAAAAGDRHVDAAIDDTTRLLPAITADEVDARFEQIQRQLWPERQP